MADHVLAIDAGTTGVTVLLFDRGGRVVRQKDHDFPQHYPKPGWVEHDADEIWEATRRLLAEVVGAAPGGAGSIAAIGITNQRETTVIWDRRTGAPIANAIVWQCRRTAPMCRDLKSAGLEPLFRRKTGLVLDAYFSGTKVRWLLDEVEGARARAEAGDLAFGTIDTWIAWKLTGGRVHATDPTNASRTLLYDIDARRFDPELCATLGVPEMLLPSVVGSAEVYGESDPALTGGRAIPLAGIAGDQQAALFGQGCVRPGMSKNTYGTGCFALVNTGTTRPVPASGLVTTIACDERGRPVFALEGSVFIAGAVLQWLRDGLGLIASAAESEPLARTVEDTGGVYLVPAFVGLGAPYWDMEARGAILGITRGTTRAHLARAALEGIAYQVRELVDCFEKDARREVAELRVDGGAVANDFLMQFQADILGKPLLRPRNIESTALGAAYLGGLATGFWRDFSEIEGLREVDRRFEPAMPDARREQLYAGWKAAVGRVLTARS